MSKFVAYLDQIKSRVKGITPFDSKDNFCTRDQRFYINAPTDVEALLMMLDRCRGAMVRYQDDVLESDLDNLVPGGMDNGNIKEIV